MTRDAPAGRTWPARALLAVGTTAIAVAVVLGALALRAGERAYPSVARVAPAVAAAPPSTLAPRRPAPPPEVPPAPAVRPPEVPPAPPPTAVLSPLALALGPRGSALPAPVVAGPLPTGLTIDALGVDGARITPVGVDGAGQVEVPATRRVGWYRHGARPGEAGATVLAAHVFWNDTPGVFARLARLEPGDWATLELDDGSTRTYEVVERAQYGKGELPADRIWTRSGPETLVLVTCGGAFNPQLRRYRDNIVVYAVPVAPEG